MSAKRYCKYCREDVPMALMFEQIGEPTVQVCCGFCRYGLDPPIPLSRFGELATKEAT